MSDHEDTEENDGPDEIVATFETQAVGESLQVLDLIGHLLAATGNVLIAIGTGFGATGMDFFRAGKKRRYDQIEQQARREMAASLEHIVYGDR